MQIFYAPLIESLPELPEEEARHALNALRLGKGSKIVIADGKGFLYNAVIDALDVRRCRVRVEGRTYMDRNRGFGLHMAIAPTKNIDRTEWFCEKAVEIGVDSISFLDCRFSGRHTVNALRIEKIAVSAMKQSLRASLPKITGPVSFDSFVSLNHSGDKFIAHCGEGDKLPLHHICRKAVDTTILIGPEGDFSREEIEHAILHGYKAVTLGQSRLRSETAALVALHTAHIINTLP
ncbi:MAG: 16S rRNA (uracil(1498)-N(3))-methyltransferase [Tannerellaceae bacterium]|jgi:16S rRNA (uracil1498-N3)-methyltransferase|nr:16S rRNA (uracil(1498)-N(3))-methyltransferase [Tannerellaceae bacterium]